MADFVFRKLLQLMGRPMAEVQRAGRAEFKRIARSGDVLEVQLGTTINEALHCGGLEIAQAGGDMLDSFEKFPIANQSQLAGFHVASAFIARRKRGEQLKI